jgi:hypothetical protein
MEGLSSLSRSKSNHCGIGLGMLFFCLAIPFELGFLPSIGLMIEPLVSPLLHYLGQWILPSCTDCIWQAISDSHGLCLLAIMCLLLGIIVAAIMKLAARTWHAAFFTLLQVLLMLYLCMQVAGYGVQKLMLQQFFSPEANTLYTPVGRLDKDILFWTTMGLSRGYNVFLGIVEIIPALLLLHYRSRTIGLIILAMVLLHVFVIDVSYGIDVRVYSAFLLSISLYLLIPRLINVWRDSDANALVMQTVHMIPMRNWVRKARPLVYALLLLEISHPILIQLKDRVHTIPEGLAGAYELLDSEEEEIKKVFLHRKGYLITMDAAQQFDDYRIMIHLDENALILLDESRHLELICSERMDTLEIRGMMGTALIDWRLKRLNINELPIMQQNSDWLVRKNKAHS